MVKPDLGTKRICPVTGRKFYDLNKDPVISPYTGQIVPIAVALTRGSRAEPARAAAVAEDPEAEEVAEVELVSLEDADEEAAGSPSKAVVVDDDLEIDDEVETDDDVTDLIGDGIEDDEES